MAIASVHGEQGVGLGVSVIIATRNCQPTIRAALDSALNQPRGLREVLVIDAVSTDGTLDEVRSYGDAVTLVSEPDDGISDAWNKGLRMSTGAWILFLGGDDRLTPNAMGHVAEMCGAEYDIVHGQALICGGRWDGLLVGQDHAWAKFRLKMTLPHQAVFHSRRLFRAVGEFDPAFKLGGDYELLLRAGNDLKCLFVPEVIAFQGGEGLSTRLLTQVVREHYRAQVKTGALSRGRARVNLAVRRIALLRNLLVQPRTR